ncbi:MAG: VPLPA-CTERM sorting domain-containing protein [Aliishimia sp.]
MKTTVLSAMTAVVLVGASAVQAAPIDLLGLGLEETTTFRSASGGVFYDDGFGLLTNDTGTGALPPVTLDGFTDSEIVFEFDGTGFADFVTLNYQALGDFEDYSIVAFGDDGGSVLEFLLERGSSDFGNGTSALGSDVIMRISSGDFDFTTFDPLAYLSSVADMTTGEFSAETSITLTALSAIAPIPVPASLPLILAGMGGLAFVGRRRKTKDV